MATASAPWATHSNAWPPSQWRNSSWRRFNWNITNLADKISLGELWKIFCIFNPRGKLVTVRSSPMCIIIFLLKILCQEKNWKNPKNSGQASIIHREAYVPIFQIPYVWLLVYTKCTQWTRSLKKTKTKLKIYICEIKILTVLYHLLSPFRNTDWYP